MSVGIILFISLIILILAAWTIRYILRLQEKKNEQQELLEYQARMIAETSQSFIFIEHGKILLWNRAAEELYGYTAKETVGFDFLDVIKTSESPKEQAYLQKEIARNGFWKGEVTHFHKNGTPLHLLISVTRTLDEDKKVNGHILVSQDITDRIKAEDELRTSNKELEKMVQDKTAELLKVFQRVSDAVMAFDRDGTITYVNDKAALLNKLHPDQMVGKSLWMHFPTAANNDFGKNFRLAVDTQQDHHFEMYSPNLERWIACFLYPSESGISLFFHDISEQRKAQEIITRSSQELRQLTSYLQEIREDERAAIAREIHDELGQQLTGIKMDLAWMAKHSHDQDISTRLKERAPETIRLVDDTIRTVRRIATELRPSILDDLGLIPAIEWQSQEFQKRSGIQAHFQSSLPDFNFNPATAIGLFRICQESLTNVARHSGAKNVWINLDWTGEKLNLSIRDDGRGIRGKNTDGQKTLGLLGIRERALMMGGNLELYSQEGQGLTLQISVTVPR